GATDLALGLATVGLLAGIIGGTLLVRWAVASPKVSIARTEPPRASDDYDIDRLHQYDTPTPDRAGKEPNLAPLTAALTFIALAIALAWVLLAGLRGLEYVLSGGSSTLMTKLPLFPFALVAGALVQLAGQLLHYDHLIDRDVVDQVAGT